MADTSGRRFLRALLDAEPVDENETVWLNVYGATTSVTPYCLREAGFCAVRRSQSWRLGAPISPVLFEASPRDPASSPPSLRELANALLQGPFLFQPTVPNED